MIMQSNEAEIKAVMTTAQSMCVAARTAPKACGRDYIRTCIVTEEEKEHLAQTMDQLAEELNLAFLHRDAENVRLSAAVVLIGHENTVRGLGAGCQFCGFQDCKDCIEKGGRCAYISIDLGIAAGSAVSVAADMRVDNRIMFSIGKAAMKMNLLGENVCQILGIPLSVRGKSPYFDRK